MNQLGADLDPVSKLRGDGVYIDIVRSTTGMIAKLNIGNVLARVPRIPQGLFLVTVLKDGGTAGDATTQCNFTYTVMDILGNTLKKDKSGTDATGMTPEFNLRSTTGACTAAADNSTAWAFDDGVNLVLWMTEEGRAPEGVSTTIVVGTHSSTLTGLGYTTLGSITLTAGIWTITASAFLNFTSGVFNRIYTGIGIDSTTEGPTLQRLSYVGVDNAAFPVLILDNRTNTGCDTIYGWVQSPDGISGGNATITLSAVKVE